MEADASTTVRVAGVRFQEVGKVYHFDVTEFPELNPGDHVIVETSRGGQLGQIMSFVPAERADLSSLKPVKRPATARDLVMRQTWAGKELDALITCREKAAQLGANNVLAKPFTIEKMKATIEAVFGALK